MYMYVYTCKYTCWTQHKFMSLLHMYMYMYTYTNIMCTCLPSCSYRKSRRLSEPLSKDFSALMLAQGARWATLHMYNYIGVGVCMNVNDLIQCTLYTVCHIKDVWVAFCPHWSAVVDRTYNHHSAFLTTTQLLYIATTCTL